MVPLIKDIVRRAAFHTGVTFDEIVGKGCYRYQYRARFAVYWVATTFGSSAARTGRGVGGRDHKTVASGVKRAEALRIADPAFRLLTDRLFAEFETGKAA